MEFDQLIFDVRRKIEMAAEAYCTASERRFSGDYCSLASVFNRYNQTM